MLRTRFMCSGFIKGEVGVSDDTLRLVTPGGTTEENCGGAAE